MRNSFRRINDLLITRYDDFNASTRQNKTEPQSAFEFFRPAIFIRHSVLYYKMRPTKHNNTLLTKSPSENGLFLFCQQLSRTRYICKHSRNSPRYLRSKRKIEIITEKRVSRHTRKRSAFTEFPFGLRKIFRDLDVLSLT